MKKIKTSIKLCSTCWRNCWFFYSAQSLSYYRVVCSGRPAKKVRTLWAHLVLNLYKPTVAYPSTKTKKTPQPIQTNWSMFIVQPNLSSLIPNPKDQATNKSKNRTTPHHLWFEAGRTFKFAIELASPSSHLLIILILIVTFSLNMVSWDMIKTNFK